MLEKLRHKWFGTEFIIFQHGHEMVIRKVETWPSGAKTVAVCCDYALLDEEKQWLQDGTKYFKLT